MIYKPENTDIHKLENWIDELGLRPIRESDTVQRLKRVRLLGTMPYTVDLKYDYSRYDHSIYVAKLADAMGRQVNLSAETRRLLVVMALLHDIGHRPFSHASEVFFRQTWGRYHTAHSSRLAHHLLRFLTLSGSNELANLVEKANTLLAGRIELDSEFEDTVIYETFGGPLSADTLDGISKTAESIGLPFPDPISIISGLIKESNSLCVSNEALPSVYDFLNLKKKIYSEYVYSSKGIAAEAMLTRALEITFSNLSDKNYFMTLDDEKTWEKMYYNSRAREIIQKLKTGQLYYSLRKSAPEKYKLISAFFNKLCAEGKSALSVKKALENEFTQQLKLQSPSQLILHSSIRLNFWNENTFQQQRLFPMPISLREIARVFKITKSYGQTLDVLFAKEILNHLNLLKTPTSLTVSEISINNNLNRKATIVEKHRGAYMTPSRIAEFLVEWAIQSPQHEVFDPASGEGVFLKAAFHRFISLGVKPINAIKNIFGVESDREYWQESLKGWKKNVKPLSSHVLNEDFFKFIQKCDDLNNLMSFDAIVGNPPYINFHRFQGENRNIALEIAKKFGVDLSQRTSSWAPYVVSATMLLKKNGRLGLVLPSELLTTDYALPIREFLLKRFKSCTFIFFNKFVFPSVQEEVLLLLASNEPPFGVRTLEVDNLESLSNDILKSRVSRIYNSKWLSNKWTHLITNQSILKIIDSLLEERKLCQFGDIASVSIGQVTGHNSFFLLSPKTIKQLKIKRKWLIPIVSKASAIPGVVFNSEDRKKLESNDNRCYMLRIPATSDVISDQDLMQYLDRGRMEGVDQGYKCRTRWPWYSVPMQPVPDAFLTYMSGNFVRLVLNSEKVYSTNTIHNVSFKGNIDQDIVSAYVVAFYSSLTSFSHEIIGRAYGGGVLKIEIGEARKIVFPNFSRISPKITKNLGKMLEPLDGAIRAGSTDIIKEIDQIVLCQGLGLDNSKCKLIAAERKRLSQRRMLRYT